ncbi:hypothetical protein GCK72_006041 [Caenorhabditis remanei]|uniref:Peptidase M13 N-terminal domain-containing protein n=1 Tax=Caenorhabditis remanei TaxID=31234 RepID=A0A6A5HF98_CAERE|nr:hypothetical protein GCK72_006041 [Caenorhabditis remanei]KAF1766085.1 hypothetical protein GCK72_006041 [Caenorhabditis remanei]
MSDASSNEKQIKKSQSSSNFFKTTAKKKKMQISQVEVGVPDPIEEQQKILGRPTPCTVLAVSTTLFILILLIVALGELGLHDKSAFEWKKPPKKARRERLELPCQTVECVKYSASLLESMNSSIHPCDNFHEHVCSGYTPKIRNFEKLLKLIISHPNSDHQKAEKIVRKMLGKCISGDTNINENRLKTIIPSDLPFPILSGKPTSSIEPVPNSTFKHQDLTKILIHISRHTPDDCGIFGITPSIDSEFTLFVIKPNTPSLTFYQFRNVLDILKRSLPKSETNSTEYEENVYQEMLNDVVELQKKLKEIEFEANPEVIRLSEIQENMTVVDWEELIDTWYPNGNKTFDKKLFGFHTTYYQKVNDLLEKTPSETLYNLLFLRFSFKILRAELSSELEETCLLQVAKTIPGKIILHGSAEPKTKELFDQMLQTIHNHLRNSLTQLKWMDSRGIEEAQKKLNKTKTLFGFDGEELIDELVISENSNYISTLCQVLKWQADKMFKSIAENSISVFLNSEVFYSVEKNELTISRSLLHYPFISFHLPNYTNFATTASRIIPQLIHAFDERGRYYDSNGRYRDWWNSDTEQYFRIIVRCFEAMTQNVFGVSVSIGWNAYDSTKEPYAVLPGMNKTDKILFFYSLVKTMCNSDSMKVNNGLASVPEFIDAFKCRNGSLMNSQPTKCKMAS